MGISNFTDGGGGALIAAETEIQTDPQRTNTKYRVRKCAENYTK